MRRSINLLLTLFNFSLKTFLEHRGNVLGLFINSLITVFFVIIFIEVIFSLTPQINGWFKYQLFLLAGIYRIMLAFFAAFFLGSINKMTTYIHKGDLDMLLTKPVNSQLLLSLRHIHPFEILNSLPGWIMVFYSLINLSSETITLTRFLILLIGCIFGLIILYSIYFMIGTLAIWMKRFNTLAELYYVIREPLAIPIDFFGRTTSQVLTFIIPLAFIITIPLKIFLNKESIIYLLLGGFVAMITLSISVWFWNFSLKHYTSTGS